VGKVMRILAKPTVRYVLIWSDMCQWNETVTVGHLGMSHHELTPSVCPLIKKWDEQSSRHYKHCRIDSIDTHWGFAQLPIRTMMTMMMLWWTAEDQSRQQLDLVSAAHVQLTTYPTKPRCLFTRTHTHTCMHTSKSHSYTRNTTQLNLVTVYFSISNHIPNKLVHAQMDM